GLLGVQEDILDRPLFVAVAVQNLDGCRRDVQSIAQNTGKLPAQDQFALFGNITLFGEAGLADQRLKARLIKLTVEAAEIRILPDVVRNRGVRHRQTQFAGLLVQRRFGDQLREQLPVQTQCTQLLGVQRPAKLADQLLLAVGVKLPELVNRNLSAAELGHG